MPKGYKKASLSQCRFCVTVLITFGDILAPKLELFEFAFVQKPGFFRKGKSCANTVQATQIHDSGSPKKGRNLTKNRTLFQIEFFCFLLQFCHHFGVPRRPGAPFGFPFGSL